MSGRGWGWLVIGSALVAAPARAAVVPAEVLIAHGEVLPGMASAVDVVSFPTLNGADQVTVGFSMVDGSHALWIDEAVVWSSDDAPAWTFDALGGATVTSTTTGDTIHRIGVGPEPWVDAWWLTDGPVLLETDPPPLLPAGTTTVNLFTPRFQRDDTLTASLSYDLDGGGQDGAVLYYSADGTLASAEIILQTGDILDGDPVAVFNTLHSMRVSPNGQHTLMAANVEGVFSSDTVLTVDDVVVAREGDSAPYPGEVWDYVSPLTTAINNDGHWMGAGHMGPGAADDSFVVYDGIGVARELDTLDGVTLTPSAGWQGVALNNVGHAAMLWITQSDYYLFHTCDASQIPETARVVLAEGDSIDTDGDLAGDAVVGNIHSLNSIHLTDDGQTFVRAVLDDDPQPSLLRLQLTCCGDGNLDIGEDCDDGNLDPDDGCSPTCRDEVPVGGSESDSGGGESDTGGSSSGDAGLATTSSGSSNGTTGDGTTGDGTTGDGTTGDGTTGDGTTGGGTTGGGTTGPGPADTGLDGTSTTTGDSDDTSSGGTTSDPTAGDPPDDDTGGDDESSGPGQIDDDADDGCSCRSRSPVSIPAAWLAFVLLGVSRRRLSR